MSTVNAETIEADKLVAKDGKDETRIEIPCIKRELPLAKLYYDANAGNPLTGNSYNVSSFTKVTTSQYSLKLIKSNVDYGGQGIQGVAGCGHDQVNSRYLEFFYLQNSSTPTDLYIQLYQFAGNVGTLFVTTLDIIVF